MAIYYVKNGGTATGDGGRVTTARTGTWNAATADYYDSIYDVFAGAVPTTAPSSGDFVYLSSSHNKSYNVNTVYDISDGITLVSVDNANQENYLKGAIESTSAVKDLTLQGASTFISYHGIAFNVDDNIFIDNASSLPLVAKFFDSTMQLTGNSADQIDFAIDGSRLEMHGGDLIFNNDSQYFFVGNNTAIALDDVTFSGTSTSLNTILQGKGAGGCTLIIINSDITPSCDSSTIILNSGDDGADDEVCLEMKRCKIPSGISFLPVTLASNAATASIEACDAGDGYHYFYYRDKLTGTTEEDTAIYRTAGSKYDGTNGFSGEMVGISGTTIFNPLKFELANFSIDTADYTTDITFTIHLARDNGTLLKDTEFWIEIEHNDGADNALGVLVDTKPSLLSTGTNLTNEAGGWTHTFTGSEGTDFDFMSVSSSAITIGASAGNIASGAVRVNVYLAINDAVFVCGKVEIT